MNVVGISTTAFNLSVFSSGNAEKIIVSIISFVFR